MKRRIVATGGLALTLLAAACGGSEPPALSPTPIPSLLPPTPAASVSIYPPPGQTAAPGQTDASPAPGDASPQAGGFFPNSAVKQTDAKATGKVDGQAISLAFDQVVEYPMYSPPNGMVNLTWADAASNALTIGGRLYEGTRKTSSAMALSLAVGSPKFDTYGSGDGTCDVTFDRLDKKYLSGSFSCRKLTGANGTTLTGASGTFTARF
jgi:hypothetical protein